MKAKGDAFVCPSCGSIMDPLETSGPGRRRPAAAPAIAGFMLLSGIVGLGGVTAGVVFEGDLRRRLPQSILALVPAPDDAARPLFFAARAAPTLAPPQEGATGFWTAAFGSEAFEELLDLEPTVRGDFMLIVRLNSRSLAGGSELRRLTVDRLGEVVAQTAAPELEAARSVDLALDGGGGGYLARYSGAQVVLDRHDVEGGSVWSRAFDAADGHRQPVVVRALPDGALLAAPGGALGTLALIRFDRDGSVRWRRDLETDGTVPSLALAAASDGAIYVGLADAASMSAIVRRMDAAGATIWTRELSLPFGGALSALVSSSDGVFALLSGIEAQLVRLEASGEVAWSVVLPPATGGAELLAAAAPENGVIIAASYELPGGDRDTWVGRVSEAGGLVWDHYLQLAGEDVVQSIAIDREEGVVIAGAYQERAFIDSDIVMIGFSPSADHDALGVNGQEAIPTAARADASVDASKDGASVAIPNLTDYAGAAKPSAGAALAASEAASSHDDDGRSASP
jgi:hypothetical protein